MEGSSKKLKTNHGPAPNNNIRPATNKENRRPPPPPPAPQPPAPWAPPRPELKFPPCQDVGKYEQVKLLGEGTYGSVIKAYEKCRPENIVALKKVITTKETDRISKIIALREIKMLKLLKHQNIILLIDVCRTGATLKNTFEPIYYMVLEFCECDLSVVVRNPRITIGVAEIKGILKQMLGGLYFIHENNIMHRDLKPANILITKSGVLKLADFGMARPFYDPKPDKPIVYSPGVCTRWYRAPEILLGTRDYGPAVDIWSAGCIMGEVFERKAILPGNSDPDQLTQISNVCGPITPEVWPEVVKTPLFKRAVMPRGHPRNFAASIQYAARIPEALDLLEKLLVLDPSRRINADAALNHDFFWTNPMPCELQEMITRHTNTVNVQRRPQPQQFVHRQNAVDDSTWDRVY